MPFCKKCGMDITDYQYDNFKGMCSECVRLEPLKSAASAYNTKSICACIGVIIIVIWIIVTLTTGFDLFGCILANDCWTH